MRSNGVQETGCSQIGRAYDKNLANVFSLGTVLGFLIGSLMASIMEDIILPFFQLTYLYELIISKLKIKISGKNSEGQIVYVILRLETIVIKTLTLISFLVIYSLVKFFAERKCSNTRF
jgi:hypothetical protein